MKNNLGFITFTGKLVTENSLTVNYFDCNGHLPRTPHGEVLINAGTIRGPLRRNAVSVVRRIVAKQLNLPEAGVFDLNDEYMLGTGYDRTREVNNEKSAGADPVGEVRLRAINPLLSLFGRWGLAGHLETWEIRTPESNLMTVGQGARSDQFERDPHLVEYLSDEDQQALSREIQANRAIQIDIDSAKKVFVSLGKEYRDAEGAASKKAVGKRMEAQKKVITDLESSRVGGEQSIKHPLAGVEAIAAGSVLSSGFSLLHGKPVYIGLFLHALNEFSIVPQLGAGTSRGYGRVRGEYQVAARRAGETQPIDLGSVRFGPSGFEINGDELKAAFDEFAERISDCNFKIHTLKALREFEASQGA